MSITKIGKYFHLQGKKMSYVMEIGSDEMLHHVYWGNQLDQIPTVLYDRAPYRRQKRIEGRNPDSVECTREFSHYECPIYGTSDFRLPALHGRNEKNGASVFDLRYAGYNITDKITQPKGMPGMMACERTQQLDVYLKDTLLSLSVTLHYILSPEIDCIARYMTVKNDGLEGFILNEVMSATIDFEDGNFSLYTLNGTTLREFTPDIRAFHPGVTLLGSTRGSSSHQHSPNAVLLRQGTDTFQGECYGLSLHSGNFVLRFEKDCYGSCRVQGGIHPLDFSWLLQEGESFDTPQLFLSYSSQGLNGLSQCQHSALRRHVVRGDYANKERPLLLNTWEGCYFDVNHERLMELGDACRETGIELLVLDDGWFGKRDSASSSLGDWIVNKEKFPGGLAQTADALKEKGIRMGIWVEPEMVSPNSDLYRAHPDWCLHVPGRVRTEWRNQLVLDLSRPEVVDYIIQSLDRIFQDGKISFVKWDMNRRLTEVWSQSLPAERQGETRHRYILGLYRILEHLVQTYPYLLMENCASGGGRYDYGMFHYFQQGWLSDNTDGVCRLKMQNAASVFYPPEIITSHVAACPNHQIGRVTPLSFRADVCTLFNSGYELDLTKMSKEELDEVSKICGRMKELRTTVQGGNFFRLTRDVMPEKEFGWMCVKGNRAVAGYFRPYCEAESAYWHIGLNGLEDTARYRDIASGLEMMGRDWKNIGWRPNWREGDYFSEFLLLEKVEQLP